MIIFNRFLLIPFPLILIHSLHHSMEKSAVLHLLDGPVEGCTSERKGKKEKRKRPSSCIELNAKKGATRKVLLLENPTTPLYIRPTQT